MGGGVNENFTPDVLIFVTVFFTSLFFLKRNYFGIFYENISILNLISYFPIYSIVNTLICKMVLSSTSLLMISSWLSRPDQLINLSFPYLAPHPLDSCHKHCSCRTRHKFKNQLNKSCYILILVQLHMCCMTHHKSSSDWTVPLQINGFVLLKRAELLIVPKFRYG